MDFGTHLTRNPDLTIAAQKTGISSHFLVSDPPSPSKRALMPKRSTSTERLRTPGYPGGMSPAACRGTGVVIISAFTVDFNMAFWTEDESKLGNLKLWRCTLPHQDDHVANERVYFPRKPIKKSQHHAIHHHPPRFCFPTPRAVYQGKHGDAGGHQGMHVRSL